MWGLNLSPAVVFAVLCHCNMLLLFVLEVLNWKLGNTGIGCGSFDFTLVGYLVG